MVMPALSQPTAVTHNKSCPERGQLVFAITSPALSAQIHCVCGFNRVLRTVWRA